MDKKVELQVLNISNSQAQVGAYAMVLGEVDGERQLPIIIGPAEAQATAICLKGIKAPRPLTHDLFYSCLNVLGATLLRVLIYKAKEGVFYSYIYFKKDEEIIRIDARTSDAVALALRYKCPIYTTAQIMDEEHLREESDSSFSVTVNMVGISVLKEALTKAIAEENYEQASRLRDEIRRREELKKQYKE
mgnify:CR=1 FL=1